MGGTGEPGAVWECAVCGRDNPERQAACILCESPRGGVPDTEEAAEREEALAQQIILEAEAEFSRQLGTRISLKIVGRPQPTTVAEAEALIAETRAQIREQQGETDES
jgi:hypothetical protein